MLGVLMLLRRCLPLVASASFTITACGTQTPSDVSSSAATPAAPVYLSQSLQAENVLHFQNAARVLLHVGFSILRLLAVSSRRHQGQGLPLLRLLGRLTGQRGSAMTTVKKDRDALSRTRTHLWNVGDDLVGHAAGGQRTLQ